MQENKKIQINILQIKTDTMNQIIKYYKTPQTFWFLVSHKEVFSD